MGREVATAGRLLHLSLIIFSFLLRRLGFLLGFLWLCFPTPAGSRSPRFVRTVVLESPYLLCEINHNCLFRMAASHNLPR